MFELGWIAHTQSYMVTQYCSFKIITVYEIFRVMLTQPEDCFKNDSVLKSKCRKFQLGLPVYCTPVQCVVKLYRVIFC